MLSKLAIVNTPLQPHQQRVVDKLRHGNLLAVHTMGSGKTLSAIAGAEELGLPTDVLAPASIVPHFGGELAKHESNPRSTYNVRSISKAVGRGEDIKPGGLLVLDEAQAYRNQGTKRLSYLKNVGSKPERILMLSGTPNYNRVSDIGPLINILKGYKALPENPADFDKEFVEESKLHPGFIQSLLGVKPGVERRLKNKKRLLKILTNTVDVHTNKEFFPKRIDAPVDVEMSPEQQKVYDYIEGKMPLWAKWKIRSGLPPSKSEAKQLNAFLTGVRQASNAPGAYVSGMTPLQSGEQSGKLTVALSSIVKRKAKDKNFKAFVYSNYLESGVDPMSALLTKAKVDHGVLHGGLTAKKKSELVEKYNNGLLPVLLGTSTAGEGLDLKGTKLVQVLDPHFNRAKIEQVIARAIRYKSHEGLPENERKVRVEEYHAEPRKGFFDKLTKPFTGEVHGVDKWLDRNARSKQKLMDEFTAIMQEATHKGTRGVDRT